MRSTDSRRFFGELATLIESGIPVRTALESIAAGSRGPLAQMARRVDACLAEGETLAGALSHAAPSFPASYSAVVEAGEQSGNLPEVLRSIVADLEQRAELRSGLLGRAAYPLTVVVLALLARPVPVALREGSGAYARELAASVAPLVLVLVAVVVLWKGLGRSASSRASRDRLLAALPLLGPAVVAWTLGRAFQLLVLLFRAGLGLERSLELAASTVTLAQVEDGLRAAAAGIAAGRRFSEAFARVPGVPAATRASLATAETAGQVDRALEREGRALVDQARKRFALCISAAGMVAYVAAGLLVLERALETYGGLGL